MNSDTPPENHDDNSLDSERDGALNLVSFFSYFNQLNQHRPPGLVIKFVYVTYSLWNLNFSEYAQKIVRFGRHRFIYDVEEQMFRKRGLNNSGDVTSITDPIRHGKYLTCLFH